MSNEENAELMMTDDNESGGGEQSNPANCQLNTSNRSQLLNIRSNVTNLKSYPGPVTSRADMIRNELNSAAGDRQMDISLSSPEECTDNRTQSSNSLRTYRKYNNVENDDDEDDNTKVVNKSQDSDDDDDDDDVNIEVDDGLFRVAGFIDDNDDRLEVDLDILKAAFKNSHLKRPFVNLYTIPSLTHDRRDITMLLTESYNSWLKGYKAINAIEQEQQQPKQQPIVEKASPVPKQSFAERMKGKTNVTTPPKQDEKELYVQLIDINSSPRLNENKSTREESLNNTTPSITSPVSEKEEKIFNKAQDFPDLYSRTNSAAKGLRSSPATYSNKSHSSPKESPRAGSSNIVVEITTEEKWNPTTGAWSSNRRPRQKQSNNDVNNPTNDQQMDAGAADEKVQCPICQRSFSKSKVESHASMCFQFPMETRSNNQEALTSSRDAPADLNNSVDLTESDDENHWETVRAKANKRKGN